MLMEFSAAVTAWKIWILNFLDNFNIAILVPKIAKKHQ